MLIVILLNLFDGYFCIASCDVAAESNTDCRCFCQNDSATVEASMRLPLTTTRFSPREQSVILKDLAVSIFHPPH